MQEMQDTQVWSLGQEDPLEKEMATHSNILAWKISRTKEPGGLQSMGLQKVSWLSNWAHIKKAWIGGKRERKRIMSKDSAVIKTCEDLNLIKSNI